MCGHPPNRCSRATPSRHSRATSRRSPRSRCGWSSRRSRGHGRSRGLGRDRYPRCRSPSRRSSREDVRRAGRRAMRRGRRNRSQDPDRAPARSRPRIRPAPRPAPIHWCRPRQRWCLREPGAPCSRSRGRAVWVHAEHRVPAIITVYSRGVRSMQAAVISELGATPTVQEWPEPEPDDGRRWSRPARPRSTRSTWRSPAGCSSRASRACRTSRARGHRPGWSRHRRLLPAPGCTRSRRSPVRWRSDSWSIPTKRGSFLPVTTMPWQPRWASPAWPAGWRSRSVRTSRPASAYWRWAQPGQWGALRCRPPSCSGQAGSWPSAATPSGWPEAASWEPMKRWIWARSQTWSRPSGRPSPTADRR